MRTVHGVGVGPAKCTLCTAGTLHYERQSCCYLHCSKLKGHVKLSHWVCEQPTTANWGPQTQRARCENLHRDIRW